MGLDIYPYKKTDDVCQPPEGMSVQDAVKVPLGMSTGNGLLDYDQLNALLTDWIEHSDQTNYTQRVAADIKHLINKARLHGAEGFYII